MFRTIKNKVLAFFMLFTLISFVIVALNLYQSRLSNTTINLNKRIDSLHIRLLDEFRCMDDFFSIELINSDFFLTHQSQYITKNVLIYKELKDLMENRYRMEFQNFDIQDESKTISGKLDSLNLLFNEIIRYILLRGFKDYGKEGTMRDYIHKADENKYSNTITILSLRRHEKDYIIRNEEKYITKLNELANNYLSELRTKKKIPGQDNDSLIYYISNYQKCFNDLVEIDRILGIKNFTGLRQEFENQQNTILSEFLHLKEKINSESKSRQDSYVFTYLLISGTILGFSIVLSFFISRILTKRITKLSLYINEFVNSGFKINGKLKVRSGTDELGILVSNFEILKETIRQHIHNLEEIVKERTLQLQKQNNDIISSITYAKTIQEALLPEKKYFDTFFPENLVFYKPRSIVSGDFYYFKRFEDKNISVVAVADCTGHGVPGAMMSMLGIAYLNEIVIRESVTSANEILSALSIQVTEHLNHNRKKLISDGMDICILIFFHDKHIVQFAGAKRDLLFVRNNELSIYKGDALTIGAVYPKSKLFTNHEFKVLDNDIFYLLTDGFQDQFGANTQRTLQKNRVYELFKEISQLDFASQESIVKKYIAYWQKDEPQTDDMLIIGFKYLEKNFIKPGIKQLYERTN